MDPYASQRLAALRNLEMLQVSQDKEARLQRTLNLLSERETLLQVFVQEKIPRDIKLLKAELMKGKEAFLREILSAKEEIFKSLKLLKDLIDLQTTKNLNLKEKREREEKNEREEEEKERVLQMALERKEEEKELKEKELEELKEKLLLSEERNKAYQSLVIKMKDEAEKERLTWGKEKIQLQLAITTSQVSFFLIFCSFLPFFTFTFYISH